MWLCPLSDLRSKGERMTKVVHRNDIIPPSPACWTGNDLSCLARLRGRNDRSPLSRLRERGRGRGSMGAENDAGDFGETLHEVNFELFAQVLRQFLEVTPVGIGQDHFVNS